MVTTQALAEKVRYVVQSLDRTRELTSLMITDLQKRSIGKSAFVLIESGIAVLRRLNNLVIPTPPLSKSGVKDILNLASADYEKNFARLRDKMHAHRQVMPMLEELAAWTSMHDDYVQYFRAEFMSAYERIRARESGLPKIKAAKPLNDRIRERVRASSPMGEPQLNASKHALYSQSGPAVMLNGPANRGQEVLDTFDVLDLCVTLNQAVKGIEWYARLTVVLFLVEAFAMFDALYNDENPDPALRELSFLEALRQDAGLPPDAKSDAAIRILENAQVQIDAKGVRDRTLRNHIGAHVDVDQPLSSLVAAIESYDWLRLANAVASSKQSFRQACEAGPLYLRLLARHKAPLRGITIGGSPDAPSYDDVAR